MFRKTTLVLLVTCLSLLIGCNNTNLSSEAIIVNEEIIQSQGFSVSSDSTNLNTSARGTVFIKSTGEKHIYAQIVALIEIDPNDWGGVVFYVPVGWHIISISSSYPENKAQAIPGNYIATGSHKDINSERGTMIEVGKDRSYRGTGGGEGTIVIDLELNEKISEPGTLSIMIGVGSDEKDGVMIDNPDYVSIEIPLS